MCISWTIKCLILLVHGATMKLKFMIIIVFLVKMIITSQNVALEGSLLCNSDVVEGCVDWEQNTCFCMFANFMTYDVLYR